MKILIALDSFKGSLSATEGCKIISQAIYDINPEITTICCPIADGGENTLETLENCPGAQKHRIEVAGPYQEKVTATFITLNNEAIIEMAQASGLLLSSKRNPMLANTYGTGELIRHALDLGYRKFTLFCGGSATNDAGCGMMASLGVQFYHDEHELTPIPKELKQCNRIDFTHLDSRINECTITLATDVTNPLCGPLGASFIYGPQKGANTAVIVRELDEILASLATQIEMITHKACQNEPGSGAAGGLAFGLMSLFNTTQQKGIERVLDLVHFNELVQDVDLVITGEGKSDNQTVFGKAPMGVCTASKAYKKPVILISGALSKDSKALLNHGFDALFSCVQDCCSPEEAIANAKENLTITTQNILRLLQLKL